MAYFNHQKKEAQQHRRVFNEPVASHLDDALEDDDYPDEEDYDDYEPLDEDDMTDEERALARRDRWRVLAGVGDFLAVIAGTVVILVLIALLVSLINWVYADITQSFTLWQTKL
ncbi:MAG: hypothetical protein IJ507_03320 [Clostridia bacterium]|nr:hypothetical protein [Clostridia bacterium]